MNFFSSSSHHHHLSSFYLCSSSHNCCGCWIERVSNSKVSSFVDTWDLKIEMKNIFSSFVFYSSLLEYLKYFGEIRKTLNSCWIFEFVNLNNSILWDRNDEIESAASKAWENYFAFLETRMQNWGWEIIAQKEWRFPINKICGGHVKLSHNTFPSC